jgi:uncharacterized protein (UPF0333 family)
MVAFFNEFISYLLLVIIMIVIGICGGFVGKKLRDKKNAKAASETQADTLK